MMATITYDDGNLKVEQYGHKVQFRVCDLTYESRTELMRAAGDIAPAQMAGAVGFLRTQSADVRQAAIEEILGVSFPLGMGEVECDG